jgi:hypothetical protein
MHIYAVHRDAQTSLGRPSLYSLKTRHHAMRGNRDTQTLFRSIQLSSPAVRRVIQDN